jgi:hypothetical protein
MTRLSRNIAKMIAVNIWLLIIPHVFGQTVANTRWDSQASTTQGVGQMLPVLALPGAQVQFFTGCTTLPCSNPATTYISATSSTACPSTAQVVWQLPTAAGCVGTTDSQGNFGGYFNPGPYQYVVTVGGTSAGPYYFNVGAGSGGGASIPPIYAVQFANSLFGAFGSDPNITINPTAHSLSVAGAGTGSIGLADSVSGRAVTQTVQAGTSAWTYAWPIGPPAGAGSCLAVTTTGLGSAPGCITGFVPQTTIASAIAAAGSTGPVIIPGNYAGTDNPCVIVSGNCSPSPNPYGLKVNDERPKSLPQVPKNEIYASDFGALCNGGTNDTPGIQAAINAAVWAYNLPTTTMAENEVVLPQGTCLIVSPLKFTGFHGSMVGAGNDATYLVGDFGSWVGTDYTVLELTATGAQPGGASVGVRRFSDFAIIGIGNSGLVSTGLKVLNTSNQYLVSYAIANVDFEHLLVAQFDTCIDFEDMANSQVQFNQIQNCRIGLQLNGNVQNNYYSHNTIDAGLLNYTSNTGNTTGFNVIQNTKYGGGSEQPQGVYFHDNSIEDWYEGILDEECIACSFDYNQVDLITGIDMQIDQNGVGGYGIWVDHNEFGMNTTTGTGMLIAATTDTPTPRNLGFWVEDNQFQLDNYPTNLPSTNMGMIFEGVVPLVNAHITGNQCEAMSVCIVMEQNLYDSVVTNNFATDALTNIVNLAGASSLVHTNTIVDHNLDYYDSITAINVGSSTGAIIGYNCSASGCTTPTWPSLGNKVYTVSTLPAASSLPAGTQLVVSDAATFTPGTCTGSGSDYMIAITNGSSWSCH